MKKIILLCFASYAVLFNSCKHDNGLFPYTQKGLNRASYMVDDKAYRIDNVTSGVDIYFGYYSRDSNLYGAATFRNSDEGIFFYK